MCVWHFGLSRHSDQLFKAFQSLLELLLSEKDDFSDNTQWIQLWSIALEQCSIVSLEHWASEQISMGHHWSIGHHWRVRAWKHHLTLLEYCYFLHFGAIMKLLFSQKLLSQVYIWFDLLHLQISAWAWQVWLNLCSPCQWALGWIGPRKQFHS